MASNPLPDHDAEYFQELQTQTGWGRTLDSFARWVDPKPGWLTLDVGCGPGLLPALFSKMGCRAIGVDLDPEMFHPCPLHRVVAVADVVKLPFGQSIFDLVPCSNLLFMLPDPSWSLAEMAVALEPGGKMAMLNPSELLTQKAAEEFAIERQMDGIAQASLLNWSKRAEQFNRWSDLETAELYRLSGLNYGGSVLKVGPGFGRYSWGYK